MSTTDLRATPPEPPDGSRIEFTYNTDVYAAWSDSASSIAAGYSAEERWCLYGMSVPCTWAKMVEDFGDCLNHLVALVPSFADSEDVTVAWGARWTWPDGLTDQASMATQAAADLNAGAHTVSGIAGEVLRYETRTMETVVAYYPAE